MSRFSCCTAGCAGFGTGPSPRGISRAMNPSHIHVPGGSGTASSPGSAQSNTVSDRHPIRCIRDESANKKGPMPRQYHLWGPSTVSSFHKFPPRRGNRNSINWCRVYMGQGQGQGRVHREHSKPRAGSWRPHVSGDSPVLYATRALLLDALTLTMSLF